MDKLQGEFTTSLLGFRRSKREDKKYDAMLIHTDKSGRYRISAVSFGDPRYQHYKDTTGIHAWSHLNHYDEDRRIRYRLRHLKDLSNKWSPGYFAWKYLWSK